MEHSLNISRDSLTRPWGFRLEEGLCTVPSLFVQKVFTNSPSEGLLQEGDVLRYINTRDCCHMSGREAINLISNAKDLLRLQVYRGRRRTISNSGSSFQWSPVESDNLAPTQLVQPTKNAKLMTGPQNREFAQKRSALTFLPQKRNEPSKFRNECKIILNSINVRDQTLTNISDDPDYKFYHQSVLQRRQLFDQTPQVKSNIYLSLPSRRANISPNYFPKDELTNSSTKQKPTELGWCPSEEYMRRARMAKMSAQPMKPSHEHKSQIESVHWGKSDVPLEREFSTKLMVDGNRLGPNQSAGNSSMSPVWPEQEYDDNEVFGSLQRHKQRNIPSPFNYPEETLVYDDTEDDFVRKFKSDAEDACTIDSNEFIRPRISTIKTQMKPNSMSRTFPAYSWKQKRSGEGSDVELDWNRSQMYRIVPASNYDSSYVEKKGVDHIVTALPLPSAKYHKTASVSPPLLNHDYVSHISPAGPATKQRMNRENQQQFSSRLSSTHAVPTGTKYPTGSYQKSQWMSPPSKQRTILKSHVMSGNHVTFVGNKETYDPDDTFGVSEF